jgi:N-acetyl-alpha-D-muramate 1-phosphate uridylyltransferase
MATRLLPLTGSIPKSLVDVNGEPFIAHQLRLLARRGIERVVICAGYLGDMLRDFVGDGRAFGLRVAFSFDGPTLLGTAGALRNAAPLLGQTAFFVLYGDSYLRCNYRAVQSAFLAAGRLALMTVFRNEGAWDRSNVEFGDGTIVTYNKRTLNSRMRHIDYGLGVFDCRALDLVPPDQPYDLAELYVDLIGRGQLAAYEVGERFYEIGTLSGLEDTRQLLAEVRP